VLNIGTLFRKVAYCGILCRHYIGVHYSVLVWILSDTSRHCDQSLDTAVQQSEPFGWPWHSLLFHSAATSIFSQIQNPLFATISSLASFHAIRPTNMEINPHSSANFNVFIITEWTITGVRKVGILFRTVVDRSRKLNSRNNVGIYNRPGRETDHSHPIQRRGQEWCSSYLHSPVFMAQCLIN
jgi:hypothetical protein